MTRVRRAACIAAAIIGAVCQVPAGAHSGLRFSSPLDGSTLGATPTHVQLTFVERPEPSLATIRVSDTNGDTYQVGQPQPLSSDPLTLTIAVRELPRGVYTVYWRVVSAVDGHPSSGVFVFGVQMTPTAAPAGAETPTAVPWLELGGRSVFLLGLIVALGSATFALLPFGGWPWRRPAATGTALAAVGLAALVIAQWRVAGAGLAAFTATSIGRAAMARAAAVGLMAAGAAVGGRAGAIVLWLAATAAVVVHAAAGHAAAGRLPVASTTTVHAIHVAAAGAWIGGLVILVAGLRHPSALDRSRAIARFSNLAAVGLVLVTSTGIARSVQEVGDWAALTTTTYGALVIAKALLLAAIAFLGALNRWRHVPVAGADSAPLRRTARVEIAFAVLAIVVAGSLASLPPPASANALAGIEVSGADFATTVKATLTAVSEQPGPNRFEVTIEDYDTGDRIAADRVSLRFTPIDDPGFQPTSLVLSKAADGAYAGTGANISFDGRWRVNILIERGATSADVPVDIEAPGRPQLVSVYRLADKPPIYTIEVGAVGIIKVAVDPERPGPARLQISCYAATTEPFPVRDMVVTAASNGFAAQSLVIQREDRHQFAAAVTLHRGTNRIAVIARTESGERLRATFELNLPDGN